MQIAKMFASLGFNVDTTGLEKFRSSVKLARTDIRNMAGDTKVAATQFRSLSAALDGLNTKLNKISVKKANNDISTSYRNVASSLRNVERALLSIEHNQRGVTKALGRIHASVKAGEPIWDRYRQTVIATRDALTSVNGKMQTLRANSSVNLKVNQGRGGSNSSGYQGKDNSFFGGMVGSTTGGMMGGFFRSMLPAVAIGGGLPAAGFAMKEIVQRGREQQKMENVLQFSSKGLQDFNDSLAFVRKTAMDLGTSSVDLGKAFAQVNMSAGETLTKDQKKKMFTEASAVFSVMGATKDEQGLLYKAVNQMFSLGRIQAEEMNQLTGQGLVPRQAVYQAVRDAYGNQKMTNADIMKMQKANQLDPSKVLPKLFENLAKQAEASGAMARYKQSSIYQQGQATEKLNQLSQQIMNGGLDAMLGKLFASLSKIVDILSDVVSGLQAAKKGIDDLTGGSSGLVTVLTTLALLFLTKGRNVKLATKALSNGFRVSRAFSILLGGNFVNAIKAITMRFGLWGLGITAVIVLLQKVGEAMKLRKLGQWTWLDDVMFKFRMIGLSIEIAMAKWEVFWTNTKKFAANPEFLNADWKYYMTVGSGTPLQTHQIGSPMAGKNAAARKERETSQNKKALDEMTKKAKIPMVNAGSQYNNVHVPSFEERFGKPVINQEIHIDGVRMRPNEVSITNSIR